MSLYIRENIILFYSFCEIKDFHGNNVETTWLFYWMQ